VVKTMSVGFEDGEAARGWLTRHGMVQMRPGEIGDDVGVGLTIFCRMWELWVCT
jgi:hypothetical protein